MVETDDFLQNFDVLKSEIYKPGRLLSVQRCDEAPTAKCSIVDPTFALDSRTQVVMDDKQEHQLLSEAVDHGKISRIVGKG